MLENGPVKVLLVEDDDLDAKLVKCRLAEDADHDFLLETVDTLAAACERLSQGNIDVILADLSLPDSEDKSKTLEVLYSKAPSIPLVILTGYNDYSFELEMVRKGIQDYVIKDQVTRQLLTRVILHAIERQRLKRENEALMGQLERLALLDPLTEFLNRRGLQKTLSREIEWVRKSKFPLLAVLLDLDDFKRVNDAFGHAVGDRVLKEVSHAFLKTLRTTDYVARIGGDEFVILLPQTSMLAGLKLAERIRLAIAETSIDVGADKIQVTASLGLAEVFQENNTVEALLSKMHEALAQSKRKGKNRISSDGAGAKSGVGQGRLLEQVLETMKDGKSYRVVKQPIFRLKDLTVSGYEFLSRSSVEPFETPEDFFKTCLEFNSLGFVDQLCFRNCVAQANKLPQGIKKHINLYPATLLSVSPDQLLSAFPKGAQLSDFCVEIGEELIPGDSSALLQNSDKLKQAGLTIAIDDVGFGKSSLESLVILEPHFVKIDKRLVIGIADDRSHLRVLERLLEVIHTLGAQVIAEGIEREEDLKVLQSLGVEYGQGFLWGQPE